MDNKNYAARKKAASILLIVVLVILLVAFLFPFLLVLLNVFKTKADITASPLAFIGKHGFTLANFPKAMEKMDYALTRLLSRM